MIKSQKIILTTVIFAAFVFNLSFVFGAQDLLPEVNIAPDSPFYFLKTWREQINLFFTFGAKNKAEQYLHLAQVRFAEYKKMLESGKVDLAAKTLKKYEDQLSRAFSKYTEIKADSVSGVVDELGQKISNLIKDHRNILGNISLEKVKNDLGNYGISAVSNFLRGIRDEFQKLTGENKGDSDLITVVLPEANGVISSPIKISGIVNVGWTVFEAVAGQVKILDSSGKELGHARLDAKGDWMKPPTKFEASLIFDKPVTKTGELLFESDNPSGLPENLKTYRVPIEFAYTQAAKTREIELYFYNKNQDKDISCSSDAILPVLRTVSISMTPIQDAIKLLLQGKLTEAEKKSGLTTEFPLAGLKLTAANLKNGVLSLSFSDPSNKTSGGSCRVGLLRTQIEKTAKQFTGVDEVKFMPEDLFQP